MSRQFFQHPYARKIDLSRAMIERKCRSLLRSLSRENRLQVQHVDVVKRNPRVIDSVIKRTIPPLRLLVTALANFHGGRAEKLSRRTIPRHDVAGISLADPAEIACPERYTRVPTRTQRQERACIRSSNHIAEHERGNMNNIVARDTREGARGRARRRRRRRRGRRRRKKTKKDEGKGGGW